MNFLLPELSVENPKRTEAYARWSDAVAARLRMQKELDTYKDFLELERMRIEIYKKLHAGAYPEEQRAYWRERAEKYGQVQTEHKFYMSGAFPDKSQREIWVAQRRLGIDELIGREEEMEKGELIEAVEAYARFMGAPERHESRLRWFFENGLPPLDRALLEREPQLLENYKRNFGVLPAWSKSMPAGRELYGDLYAKNAISRARRAPGEARKALAIVNEEIWSGSYQFSKNDALEKARRHYQEALSGLRGMIDCVRLAFPPPGTPQAVGPTLLGEMRERLTSRGDEYKRKLRELEEFEVPPYLWTWDEMDLADPVFAGEKLFERLSEFADMLTYFAENFILEERKLQERDADPGLGVDRTRKQKAREEALDPENLRKLKKVSRSLFD